MTQASNFRLLYRNRVDDGIATASSQLAGAEAAFVQTMDPGDAWRANGKTSEHVQIDFGAAVSITHGGAVEHNLDATGTISFRLSNDATFDPANDLFNSGDQEAWEPVAGFGYDGLGSSLGGYPILDAFNDWAPLKVFDCGGSISARYARFTFKNPTNAAISGVACGRLFAGTGAQGQRNFAWDWVKDWEDPSDVQDTEAGVRIKRRRRRQVLRIEPKFLTETEALTWWDDLKRTVGASKDVILELFPAATAPKRYRTSLYGVPVDRGGTRNPFLDVYASSIHVRELRA
ncbi:MAG: hypothetical protein SFV21_00245 [Rhodospirillaceae bacterium]|nr:hypothetical protein [Rhodospirillaceae bacterium]